MTHLVSIITAVYEPVPEFLHDAYQSIRAQKLPAGWDWQWIVQEDGETGKVAGLLPEDSRIITGTGRRGRAGMARTLALARADGELVKVLDADDQLAPGVLARDIAALENHPDVGWTTSRVLDLLPDGSTAGFDADPPAGRITRGSVFTYWQTHHYRAQVHPATLCIRRELVMALGGWMALPASEDTGLLMAADAVCDGWFNEETGLLYRKWPGQSTSQAAHTQAAEWTARMRVIEMR
ncbi:MAG: glycosyltransferase, partial [Thermobispora bispora]|nr:glycosyltransferase [Thermobispora bispora]